MSESLQERSERHLFAVQYSVYTLISNCESCYKVCIFGCNDILSVTVLREHEIQTDVKSVQHAFLRLKSRMSE